METGIMNAISVKWDTPSGMHMEQTCSVRMVEKLLAILRATGAEKVRVIILSERVKLRRISSEPTLCPCCDGRAYAFTVDGIEDGYIEACFEHAEAVGADMRHDYVRLAAITVNATVTRERASV